MQAKGSCQQRVKYRRQSLAMQAHFHLEMPDARICYDRFHRGGWKTWCSGVSGNEGKDHISLCLKELIKWQKGTLSAVYLRRKFWTNDRCQTFLYVGCFSSGFSGLLQRDGSHAIWKQLFSYLLFGFWCALEIFHTHKKRKKSGCLRKLKALEEIEWQARVLLWLRSCTG